MEWEYLTVTILAKTSDGRFVVLVRDREDMPSQYVTLDHLGLDRWELVTVLVHHDDMVAFMKRQKMYPM